jgi:hypothetical protein
MYIDPEQLEIGTRVEMEHTRDPRIARRIALDHLAELPDYYTRLAKMEREELALGKVYMIGTNVPLIGTVQADIPIEDMTRDAMVVVGEEAKKTLPWVIAGGALVVMVSMAIVGAFVLGKRRG